MTLVAVLLVGAALGYLLARGAWALVRAVLIGTGLLFAYRFGALDPPTALEPACVFLRAVVLVVGGVGYLAGSALRLFLKEMRRTGVRP